MKPHKQMSDEQLVRSYQRGDNKAFDELLFRYKGQLYSYILILVRNRDVADDIFQDTFCKAIMTIQNGRYTEQNKFSAWITRIARNLVIDIYRSEKNLSTISNDETEADLFNNPTFSDPTIEMRLVHDQSMDDIRQMIGLLPAIQREVVYLRFYQELSFREIAEMTGVSINTALGRMRYALGNLRKMVYQNHKILQTV